MSGKFGYMGRSNPWRDRDQMWPVDRCGRRNHVCSRPIWWLSVKGCGCGKRGNFALFHWLEVWPCDNGVWQSDIQWTRCTSSRFLLTSLRT